MGRFEAVALPDIGIFTISGVTNAEMARHPFGGAGYHIGALVRGVNLVEKRLNEERLIFVQEEIVKPMSITVCDKQRVFESERKAMNEVIAADATKSESDRKVAQAIVEVPVLSLRRCHSSMVTLTATFKLSSSRRCS